MMLLVVPLIQTGAKDSTGLSLDLALDREYIIHGDRNIRRSQ